ncbi:MAG: hypothetical protein WCH09_07055, partial [Bacteroidota bacterium]
LLTKQRNPLAHQYHTEQNLLIKYREIIDRNGFARVEYKKTAGHIYGRSNPVASLGLFMIRCEVRHTICEGMTDVDIENAHPNIIRQILNSNVIECPELTKYCANRNKYLKTVMDFYKVERWSAKTLFIVLLYGGGFENWVSDTKHNAQNTTELELIKSIRKEMKIIAKTVADANPELRTFVEQKHQEYVANWNLQTPEFKKNHPLKYKNVNGTTCSYFLQEYEVRILETLYLYCEKQGYIKNNIGVLAADGIMMMTADYKPSILIEFNNIIKEKFGIDLVFTTKPMNEGFKNLDDHINFNFGSILLSGFVAEYFKMMFGDKWICKGGVVYHFNGVYWQQDDKTNTELSLFINNKLPDFIIRMLNYKSKKLTKNLESLTGTEEKDAIETEINETMKLIGSVINLLSSNKPRKGFVDDVKMKITDNYQEFDENPFLFAFTNKIFDLRDKKEVKPNPKDFISITTGYDYVKPTIQQKQIVNSFIEQIYPDPEVRNYALLCRSTGLCGLRMTQLFIDTGVGGNGKSIMNDLMLSLCGNYGYKASSSVVCNPIKDGANPQVANLNRVRFVYFEEPDAKLRLCMSTIKEITGGETINARQLYSGVCCVKLSCSLFGGMNTIPRFDEVNEAVNRRMIVSPYESRFLKSDEFNKYTELGVTNIFPQNPDLETTKWKAEHRSALFETLLDSFQNFKNLNFRLPSQSVKGKKICSVAMKNSDDLFTWFEDNYEPAETERVSVGDIYRDYKNGDYYYNLTKNDKRNCSMKKFENLCENNFMLKDFIKLRDQRFNGVMIKENMAICGWRKKTLIVPPVTVGDGSTDEEFDVEYVDV